MSEYDIRYCKIDEVGKLVEFLRKHWKEDHVFVCNRKVLDFQHLDEENQRYNFLVAHNIKTGQFDAILGFIPTNKFDCKLETQDVWLAIWKVKKQYAKTGIGLQLLMEIMRIYKNGSVGIMGASEDAIKIYKALKYMMGELNHYYIANFNIKTQLAYFKNRHERNIQNIQNRYCIKKISKECLIDSALEYKFKPYKSIEYFINRYHNAEFYDYNFYGIYEDNLILAAFVAKIIEIKGANCMRIVDWIGEFVGDIYYPIQQLLKKYNLEYIDLVCLVPKRNHEILNMGFTLKDKNDVVPNYFEPFIKKNVIITVAWKSNDNGYAFFKGDSDQERPNFLKD